MQSISVLIVNQSIKEVGVLSNVAFVLGLTAGRLMPPVTFGEDVTDGSGRRHRYLTGIPHIVRKAGTAKLIALREALSNLDQVHVVDYAEEAATSSYAEYEAAIRGQTGDIQYRAIHVFGPFETVYPLTKNLSRL
jgi:hypothetical protein